MGKHAGFIAAAYAVTGVAVSALILYIIADYRRLRRALSKFPPRDGDSGE